MESRGLTSAEAAARLIKFGWNELPSSQRKSIWKIALEVVQEPMFILLLICSALYLLLGDLVEGIILFLSIFVIIAITFYQSRKSERALEELKKLASPLVTVVRDGVQHRIPSRELVPGDVMLIKEGQRVAADARIIDGMNLCMDESILTGESLPVTKFVSSDETSMDSLVFSGTMAVQGFLRRSKPPERSRML
ncbi:MAG TPA: HAD-IC family P-type ATPase [Saprospiraceae bacterium]|nr:HAD-IC family P-type ATPase [Saprospiraceae bacterium]